MAFQDLHAMLRVLGLIKVHKRIANVPVSGVVDGKIQEVILALEPEQVQLLHQQAAVVAVGHVPDHEGRNLVHAGSVFEALLQVQTPWHVDVAPAHWSRPLALPQPRPRPKPSEGPGTVRPPVQPALGGLGACLPRSVAVAFQPATALVLGEALVIARMRKQAISVKCPLRGVARPYLAPLAGPLITPVPARSHRCLCPTVAEQVLAGRGVGAS
mmetsp:Transcript_101904/g.297168  ORF Transcript_101904/g.297168 Transcript_101904/m.297168 type:complete len:214 (+) Transcript_101904:906-1547(+)